MKILFDVGANSGENSIDIISKNNDWICFAFEPTPKLIEYLTDKTKNISDRYHIIPYAVSDFDGEAPFYITGDYDWGSSSLLKFSDNVHINWEGRPDLKVTETTMVKVITLKTFIEQISPISIEKIDYFHCDAQGSDLKILKGMDKYISLIVKGMVEASNKNNVTYIDQNTYNETNMYLIENGFKTSKTMNDPLENEVNIMFEKLN